VVGRLVVRLRVRRGLVGERLLGLGQRQLELLLLTERAPERVRS
jgi:hypothetical protein